MENKTIILFALFALYGCGSINLTDTTKIDPKVTYDHDMAITVDGVVYDGVGVLPKKDVGQYDILVEARADIDILTFDTCTKHLRAEKSYNVESRLPVLLFWSRKVVDKRKYAFKYSQDSLERKRPACHLQFQAFNAKDGKHSFGLLAVEDPRYILPAWVTCNLDHKLFNGISMCKNQENKFTEIAFTEPVIAEPELNDDKKPRLPACVVKGMDLESKVFDFEIAPKTCAYTFKGMESGKKHVLTIVGWQDFIPRY